MLDEASGKAFMLMENVIPDPTQPRQAKSIDQAEIARLGQSLANGGQLQPIVVDWQADVGKWMIVVGDAPLAGSEVRRHGPDRRRVPAQAPRASGQAQDADEGKHPQERLQ